MKKYLYIFKSELMTSLGYTFDILIGFIGYAIMIFIFLNLWEYIYSDPNQILKGFTMNDMIWYIIVTEIIWSTVKGRTLSKEICNDVKSGNITYNIIKPYNYIEYRLFSHLGGTIFKFILLTILGMILGFIFLGSFPSISIFSIFGVLLSCLLACIISILIIISIGLLSFFIEDAHPLFWVYSKILLVIGTIFPIEFFPEWIQPVLKFTPAYTVCYGPAKLFVHFSSGAFLEILIAQLISILIFAIIAHLIYKKGAKKLNVNGG